MSDNTNRQLLNGLFAAIGGFLFGTVGLFFVGSIEGVSAARWVAALFLIALVIGSAVVAYRSARELMEKDGSYR